jgi:hypothetical protein
MPRQTAAEEVSFQKKDKERTPGTNIRHDLLAFLTFTVFLRVLKKPWSITLHGH